MILFPDGGEDSSSRSSSAHSRKSAASPPGSAGSGKKAVAWHDPEKGKEEEKGGNAEDDVKMTKELEEELNREDIGGKEDQAPVGCWATFTGFISSMWDTTDMKPGEEREVIVRTSLRELVIYVVFLVILCIVTLSAMSTTMYRYTLMVKSLFKTYQDVRQVQGFWDYMEGDFLDALYWEEWYNEGIDNANFPCPGHPNATGPCPIDAADRMVMHANR